MTFQRLVLITLFIALLTIILGAYTRLSNAGLGCPDWPGCYGQLSVPTTRLEQQQAYQNFPDSPLEEDKAWKEMLHRYIAGTLGLMISAIAIWSWLKSSTRQYPILLPSLLFFVVIFQATLGMWTVTLLLKPLVVVTHLIFGFITLALLFLLSLQVHGKPCSLHLPHIKRYKLLAWLGLSILSIQIALGGWTSSNYAALACPDFPTCQGQWLPETNFSQGFTLWHGVGINYEGGILNSAARTAIHITHRIGAIITVSYLLILALMLINNPPTSPLRRIGGTIALLVMCQFSLGIANVYWGLPLAIATAHNVTAALLVIAMVWLIFHLYSSK